MKCIGLLGEIEGYAAGMTWSAPVIEEQGQLLAPKSARWTVAGLEELSNSSAELAVRLPFSAEIREADVVVLRGDVLRSHQEHLGITSALEWIGQLRSFDFAVTSLDMFNEEQQRIRDSALTHFWTAILEADSDRCRSAWSILRVNATVDRTTPVMLRALMSVRFPNPTALMRSLEVAQLQVGVSPHELLDHLKHQLSLLDEMDPVAGAELMSELGQAKERLLPSVPLDQLLLQRNPE